MYLWNGTISLSAVESRDQIVNQKKKDKMFPRKICNNI